MRIVSSVVILLLSSACQNFPDDVDGTTERVEQQRLIRLGIVSGTDLDRLASDAIDGLAARFEADIQEERAPAEILIDRLEEGEIDLLVGAFAANSVVKTDVSLSRSFGPEPRDGSQPALRFARKHGENRWILVTDQAAQP